MKTKKKNSLKNYGFSHIMKTKFFFKNIHQQFEKDIIDKKEIFRQRLSKCDKENSIREKRIKKNSKDTF